MPATELHRKGSEVEDPGNKIRFMKHTKGLGVKICKWFPEHSLSGRKHGGGRQLSSNALYIRRVAVTCWVFGWYYIAQFVN
jgi:hypothetical protein